MTENRRTHLFSYDVVSKDDFFALLDQFVEEGEGPQPFANHLMHRYVGVIADAIHGRQCSAEVLRRYEECSWRHLAEILSSARTRD
jgi:hypothetical protein